jgi:hypothetical protein
MAHAVLCWLLTGPVFAQAVPAVDGARATFDLWLRYQNDGDYKAYRELYSKELVTLSGFGRSSFHLEDWFKQCRKAARSP